MQILQQEALQFYDLGYNVIPAVGKIPSVTWNDYKSNRGTREEIINWFSEPKNIAIVTGRTSGITVVDFDEKAQITVEEFLKLHPTGHIVKTAHGHHLYYKYNPNFRNKVGYKELYHLDIRNDGGIVIAPPSMHESGVHYTWIQREWFGDLNIDVQPVEEKESQEENKWIGNLLKGISSGGRNDACARLGGYLVSKEIPIDIALGLVRSWNKSNVPPLPDSELKRTIQSVYEYAKEKKTEAENVDKKPIGLMNFNEYLSTYSGVSVKWLIDDWLPTETIGFMVAPPGSYKTWLLMDLVISVAGGFNFLGHFPVNDSGPVFVFQQEDNHAELSERITTVLASKAEQLGEGEFFMPDLPIYFHPDRLLRFDNPEIVAELEELIDKHKPKLVVIDPLYSVTSVDNYMDKAPEQMFPMKKWRDKYGTSFLMAHHNKKQKSDNIDREDLWGSTFLNAFLESGWQIRKTSDRSIKIHRHFKKAGAMKLLEINFNISTQYPPIYECKLEELTTEEDTPQFDRNSLMKFIKSKSRTLVEICDKFDMHEKEVKKQMSMLITQGHVIEKGGIYEWRN